MGTFSRIVEILAALIIMFIFPVLNMAQKQSVMEELLLEVRLTEFADRIQTHGYLSEQEYDRLHKVLGTYHVLGEIYVETVGLRTEELSGVSYDLVFPDHEIMEALATTGVVRFQQGDSLSVTIEGRFAGITGLLRRIFGTDTFFLQTGGVIRDEIEPVCLAVP